MHDTTNLETRGIPSVFVATNEFQEAAKAQATALGVGLASVFVAHPIQDRTDAEIRVLAEGALSAITTALTIDS